MRDFYGRVLDLSPLTPGARGGHSDRIAFYRLGEGFGGHVPVLALFADPSNDVVQAGARSSFHHLALSLPWDEQVGAADWLRAEGCEARFVDFAWTGWRGLFTRDPDGNTVELVAAAPDWHLS